MVQYLMTKKPRIYGERMVLGKLDSHMQKDEVGPLYTKINSEWIRDVSVRSELNSRDKQASTPKARWCV